MYSLRDLMEATYVSLSEISGFEFYESELFKWTL